MPADKRAQLPHFLAGASAGVCSGLVLQPLDVIKTRQQQLTSFVASGKHMPALAARGSTAPATMVGTAQHILSSEGAGGLYRGLVPSLVRVVPGAGLFFFFVHKLSATMRGDDPTRKLSGAQNVAVGATARAFAATLMNPSTVVKTRYEAHSVPGQRPYRSVVSAFTTLARVEGARGLLRGIVPQLLKDCPYAGIYLLIYRGSMAQFDALSSTARIHVPPVAHTALSGALAGGVGTLLTHPPDVVRTRLQLQPLAAAATASGGGGGGGGAAAAAAATATAPPRMGLVGAVRDMATREGGRVFFRGLAPRMLKRSIQSALVWTVYERLVHVWTGVLAAR